MALTVAQIDAAITAVINSGQEYTIGDRTYRRGDLEILQSLRKVAVAIEAAAKQNIFQRARFGSIT